MYGFGRACPHRFTPGGVRAWGRVIATRRPSHKTPASGSNIGSTPHANIPLKTLGQVVTCPFLLASYYKINGNKRAYYGGIISSPATVGTTFYRNYVTSGLDDFSLIDRVLGGNPHAYGLLVQRYQHYAYTLAVRLVHDAMAAEEVAQDAFVKAYQALPTFQRDAKFSTWLYRIVVNQALMYRRKKRPEHTSEFPVDVPIGGAANAELLAQERRQYLDQAMAQLKEEDRLLLTLFYFQELSLEEIAEVVQKPVNTLKVNVHRCRARLAKELGKLMKHEIHSLL